MKFDNTVVVFKSNNTKHLSVIQEDQTFVTQNGTINHNDIKTLPTKVKTSKDQEYEVYIPSFDEFILLMKRGPQIIYPKDIGSIIISGNISKFSNILEIGTGSGALTLYLSLILDKDSNLITLDESNKNQRRAKKTIERYISSNHAETKFLEIEYLNLRLSDFIFDDVSNKVDTVITDIPEPWEFFDNNSVKQNLQWVSYLPSITQVQKIVTELSNNNFININVTETLNREWIVDNRIVRPKNEMVGHTGFVVSGRFLFS